MSVKPVSSLAAGFTALGLMATGPLTGSAHAQELRPIQINATADDPALVEAGTFGNQSPENVGILVYYGSGNGSPSDAVGERLVSDLETAASAQGIDLDANYYVQNLPEIEGILVGFFPGPQSIGPVDIRTALQPQTYQTVINQRLQTNRTMSLASLER